MLKLQICTVPRYGMQCLYCTVRLVMHAKKTKRRDNGTRTELDATVASQNKIYPCTISTSLVDLINCKLTVLIILAESLIDRTSNQGKMSEI